MVPGARGKNSADRAQARLVRKRSDDEKMHDSQDGDTGGLRFQPERARPARLRRADFSIRPLHQRESTVAIPVGWVWRGGRGALFRRINEDTGRENCFLRNFLRNNSVRVEIDEKNPRY